VVILINIISFNLAWIGLVYFGNSFIPIATLFLIIHFVFLSNDRNEIRFSVFVCFIGIAIDSSLKFYNIFIFQGSLYIPVWLVFLWVCFSTTLCHSLRFLEKSIWIQIAAGLIAPFSYIAGNKLGAVDFGESTFIIYIILALIWSTLFVLFFYLKRLIINPDITMENK
jgi:hypothetical protein